MIIINISFVSTKTAEWFISDVFRVRKFQAVGASLLSFNSRLVAKSAFSVLFPRPLLVYAFLMVYIINGVVLSFAYVTIFHEDV